MDILYIGSIYYTTVGPKSAEPPGATMRSLMCCCIGSSSLSVVVLSGAMAIVSGKTLYIPWSHDKITVKYIEQMKVKKGEATHLSLVPSG